MKTSILWIVGAMALCLVGWLTHRIWQNKNSSNRISVEEEPLSEQQQALAQLRQHRENISLAHYRYDCAALFSSLSGGIQAILAQESRPCPRDAVFCHRLAVTAENESLLFQIESRKERQVPNPITPEEAEAAPETIREIIRVETLQSPIPGVKLPWETLMEQLLPCLEALPEAAEADQAEDCRGLLTQLRKILADYSIYPIWYHDSVVQHDPVMQLDYISRPAYPVPVLYYRNNDTYIRIGSTGCTGTISEKES